MIVQGTIITSFTTVTLKYIITKVKGDDDNLRNNKARRKASGQVKGENTKVLAKINKTR